jgi:hypothetical protein
VGKPFLAGARRSWLWNSQAAVLSGHFYSWLMCLLNQSYSCKYTDHMSALLLFYIVYGYCYTNTG